MKTHSRFQATMAWLGALATSCMLAACGGGGGGSASTPPVVTPPIAVTPTVFEQASAPAKLSAWNLASNDGTTLTLNAAVVPYDLNSALFTDYAFKLRGIYVPSGKKINYKTTSTLDFPVGTAIVKTFYYPKATGTDASLTYVSQQEQSQQGNSVDLKTHRLVETRILVLQADGKWVGIPYVWDADQRDATLNMNGAYIEMALVPTSGAAQPFTYAVPKSADCQTCHASSTAGSGSTLPIGPHARNLNKSYSHGGVTKNQLQNLSDLGLMSGFTGLTGAPAAADWKDAAQPLEARAKAYLDINCAHCHNNAAPQGGYASQSGLLLTHDNIGSAATDTWGVCKETLAYGGVPHPGKYDIVPRDPDNSVMLFRMSSVTIPHKMPVIGRQLAHTEALGMIRSWINQLPQANCAP